MICNLKKHRCQQLLNENYIGHLGYVFKNKPFVLPITCYYNILKNTIICYSGEGHKIKALRANKNVSLEVAEISSVNKWQCVVVEGIYREFQGSTAKLNLHNFFEGVKNLIQKKEGKNPQFISEFSSKIYKQGPPVVFEIAISDVSGRERK
ncbi:pyridoxamine 5'-phosphate oxidase family protein [Winogradskyella sp.]|uniref:pyridoxamine 5'-phosphate oxidase family protein n=1 Tax=Winogradskyella sp. TaxID=1883156 RepID=UPI00261EB8F4|nr:pyridoxamine 5'-phosphate oxidase family protein [Winogradskyella sp.]